MLQPPQPVEHYVFDAEGEVTINVCRGAKQAFPNVFAFWLQALRAQDWSGRQQYLLPYARQGLWRPLSEQVFLDLVTHTSQDVRVPLPPWMYASAPWVAGWWLYDDWNDRAAVAEYADWYVAYQWETSA